MDVVPGPFSAAAIASLEAVAVADITNPTELAALAGSINGERRVAYQVVAADNVYTTYYWDSADSGGASSPYVVAGSSGFWIAAGGRYTNSAQSMRSTLLVTGLATLTAGLTTPAQITSTIATGTAPLVVASTTVVGNLNVSQLLGSTWTAPGTIGSVTPTTGKFTTVTATGLTSGRVPFAGTGGLLGDSLAFTFSFPSFANLVVGSNAQAGSSFVTFNNATGFSHAFLGQVAGVNRWQLAVGDGATESGSDAGNNFSLGAYSDTGVFIDSPLTIARAGGGTMALTRPTTIGSTLDVTSTGTFGNGTAAATVIVNGVAATARQFVFRTAGSNRWAFQADSTAESGANAGTNFVLGARDDAGVAIDSPMAIVRAAGGAVTFARPVTLSTASSGLTIAITTGTSLVVSSTAASTTTTSGCATFAGGIGVVGKIFFGNTLTAGINSGSTINLDLSDTAASRTVSVLRVNTSATAHTTIALVDVVSSASTSSDKMVRVRANSVDLLTVNADGSAAYSGIQSITNATASTTTGTGAVVITGGLGVGGAVNCGALASTTATHSGVTSVTDTTDATTATAASLKTLGGIGATKNILGKQGLGWGVTSVATAAGTTVLTTASTAIQVFTGVTTQTVTLPAANAFGAGIGFVLIIKNVSTGAVTVNRAGGDTINTTATGATTFNVATISQAMLVSDGVSAWEKII